MQHPGAGGGAASVDLVHDPHPERICQLSAAAEQLLAARVLERVVAGVGVDKRDRQAQRCGWGSRPGSQLLEEAAQLLSGAVLSGAWRTQGSLNLALQRSNVRRCRVSGRSRGCAREEGRPATPHRPAAERDGDVRKAVVFQDGRKVGNGMRQLCGALDTSVPLRDKAADSLQQKRGSLSEASKLHAVSQTRTISNVFVPPSCCTTPHRVLKACSFISSHVDVYKIILHKSLY